MLRPAILCCLLRCAVCPRSSSRSPGCLQTHRSLLLLQARSMATRTTRRTKKAPAPPSDPPDPAAYPGKKHGHTQDKKDKKAGKKLGHTKGEKAGHYPEPAAEVETHLDSSGQSCARFCPVVVCAGLAGLYCIAEDEDGVEGYASIRD